MDLKQLEELRKAADAKFNRDAAELRLAAAEEARLRAELRALDAAEDKRAAAFSGNLEVAFAQTGEALWQTWADRRRRELNMLLAHQLAVKEEIKSRARKSFGKTTALDMLAKTERANRAEDQRKRETEALIEFECSKKWARQ